MNRRQFITSLGGAAKVYRIGYLGVTSYAEYARETTSPIRPHLKTRRRWNSSRPPAATFSGRRPQRENRAHKEDKVICKPPLELLFVQNNAARRNYAVLVMCAPPAGA
jgi:hypothetical protein